MIVSDLYTPELKIISVLSVHVNSTIWWWSSVGQQTSGIFAKFVKGFHGITARTFGCDIKCLITVSVEIFIINGILFSHAV